MRVRLLTFGFEMAEERLNTRHAVAISIQASSVSVVRRLSEYNRSAMRRSKTVERSELFEHHKKRLLETKTEEELSLIHI